MLDRYDMPSMLEVPQPVPREYLSDDALAMWNAAIRMDNVNGLLATALNVLAQLDTPAICRMLIENGIRGGERTLERMEYTGDVDNPHLRSGLDGITQTLQHLRSLHRDRWPDPARSGGVSLLSS